MTGSPQLDPRIASAFYGGFRDLHPAQEACIAPLLAGRNVALSAGTGSGKTEAVIAPLVDRIWRAATRSDGVFILYIAPTKALVNDLEKRLSPVLERLGLHLGIRHGDRDDLKIKRKPHVLLTTPESLDVLLFRKDASLSTVSAVVIDEVHLLYNTQRGLQLSILLRRLESRTENSIQFAMQSATAGRLEDVVTFLLGDARQADLLSFPPERSIDAQVRRIRCEEDFLTLMTRLLAGSRSKLLVFTDSRRECERLSDILQLNESLANHVYLQYSSLAPEVRVETERLFAEAQTAICIATPTLELGIDIGDIDAVVLWGPPASVESFLQRIGRGNRRSTKANVICLISDRSVNDTIDALRFAVLIASTKAGDLPVRGPYELYGAVAQQILGHIASEGGGFARVADLCEMVAGRAYLDRTVIEDILGELHAREYLVPHGFKNRYGSGENLHQLVDHRLIYGNFGAGSQTIDVFHGSKLLGAVPAINLLRTHRGETARFVGKTWRIASASIDAIKLVPAAGSADVDFIYPGSGAKLDPSIPDRVWQFLHSGSIEDECFDAGVSTQLQAFVDRARDEWSWKNIPFNRGLQGYRYFTFAGYLVNKAIGLIKKCADFSADEWSLTTSLPIDWHDIPQDPDEFSPIFDRLFEMTSKQSIYQSLLPHRLQQKEFLQEWLHDESLPHILRRLRHGEPVETKLELL